jgi:hypothetical protein
MRSPVHTCAHIQGPFRADPGRALGMFGWRRETASLRTRQPQSEVDVSVLILLLLVAALVCLVIATFVPALGRVNMVAAGLALCVLTVLLPQLGVH